MADVRSISNQTAKSADNHVEQMRQKLGTEFSSQKLTGKKNRNELGKDDFMKLMSAQLKHQDPLNPLKNEEMAAQLAQFSALEQMMNVNQNLEKMQAAQKPQDNVLAASLIGKRVFTDSSKFSLLKGATPELKFELPGDAEAINVSLLNEKGEVIREIELGAMAKGTQSVRWDGKNGKNLDAELGEYSYRVTGTGEGGKPIQIDTSTSGLVSGVVFEGGKALLSVDDKKIALETVSRIDSDAAGAANKAKGPVNPLAPVTSRGEAPAKSAAAPAKAQQNSSSEKSTQQAKNNLNDELTPEKIKLMLESMRPSSVETAGNQTAEGTDGGNGAFPLWNPANL